MMETQADNTHIGKMAEQTDFRRLTESFVYRQMNKFNGIQSREQLFEATKSVFEGLGVYFHADRVFIYQQYHQEHVQHIKYGWRDWKRINNNLNEENCAFQILQCYEESLRQDQNVVICGHESIRDSYPSLYRPFVVNQVHDWIAVPLFNGGELDGILSVVNPDMEHLDTLAFLLRGTANLFQMCYQVVTNMESLVRLNAKDMLTDLDSRRSAGQKVNESLQRGEQGAFMLIDCDNFKQVNERFGHQVGDHLLVALAQVIQRVFHQGIAMRLGADEFGVFFPLLVSDRNWLGQWTSRLFNEINRLKVDGLTGYRVAVSIGAFAYEASTYESFDQIYQKARTLCREAKEYEGNYLMTDRGGIPDLETAFYLLREDRHLYDRLNDDMFSITDEDAWMKYLDNCAMLKSNMCWRNQRQYDQILNYFNHGNTVEDDYTQLYMLVLKFRNTLDAFMVETLVGEILLPHYEQLQRSEGHCPFSEQVLCGRLAKLYLHLGDSLVGIFLMGDVSQAERIHELFGKCISVSKSLKPDDPAYEYQIYALSQLLGHYELYDLPQLTSQQRDAYYLKLREFVIGPKAITLRDAILLPYYTYLLQNARSYPLLRASQLALKGDACTAAEQRELSQKLNYVRHHLVDGVLDTAYPHEVIRRVEKLLLAHLFQKASPRELFLMDYAELLNFRNSMNAVFNTSDLMTFLILVLAATSSLKQSDFSPEEKRRYALEGWDLFLMLYKRRKNEATDRQSWFMACFLLSIFIRNHMLTPQDKREFLVRTMGVLMLDTYSHSKAMAAFAHVITEHLILHHPKLLVGVRQELDTVRQVKSHRQELLEFVNFACMVHDIGKLVQTPIISNSYRKLTDHEFQILRMHPMAGCQILHEEPYFSQFNEIISGHHRSFDCQSGYPQTYQFEHSEQHILVDIISICDSLEAATSHIGRNYREAKPFSQIMDEFYAEAGTRYNPHVLEAIVGSPGTYNRLKTMVDKNWRNVYKSIFQEIVKEHNTGIQGKVAPLAESNGQASQMKRLMNLNRTTSKDTSLSMDQLRRLATDQQERNQWLTQKLVESVESKHELDQMNKGLLAVFEVMALVQVKDGSIKILQGRPEFLQIFPTTQWFSMQAMSDFSVKHVVKPKWIPELLKFHDPTTLADRLRGRKSVNLELETKIEGWCRFSYYPTEYDEQGNLEKALFTSECINDEVLAFQRIKFVAEYDGLTGLYSRYGGEGLIRKLIKERTPGVFAVMDVDHFKSINDTFGHAVGDKVLAAIGQTLRKDDDFTIMRQGGDEFVLFRKSQEDANFHREAVDELFKRLSCIRIPELKGEPICMSVGAVIYDGKDHTTFDELFRTADRLLYVSKRYEGSYLSIEKY